MLRYAHVDLLFESALALLLRCLVQGYLVQGYLVQGMCPVPKLNRPQLCGGHALSLRAKTVLRCGLQKIEPVPMYNPGLAIALT